jgi:hypothetical protein
MLHVFLLLLIFIGLIFYMYITRHRTAKLNDAILVQGVRIRASLDEIFSKIKPSNKIDMTHILSNGVVIWSNERQLELSSAYYNINVYTLIIRSPEEVDVDILDTYKDEIAQRLEFLLKRRNVVISLTDVNGYDINEVAQYSFRSVYILSFGVLLLGFALYMYVKITRKK